MAGSHSSSSSFPYSSSNLCHIALSLAIRRCILTRASYCRILLSASTMDPNAIPDIWMYLVGERSMGGVLPSE